MDFFGASIDYNAVDIQPSLVDGPHTFGNTIHIPDWMGGCKQDQSTNKFNSYKAKLLHEMEHVRQNKHGEFVTLKAGYLRAMGRVVGFFKALFTAPFSKETFKTILENAKNDYI